MSDPSVIALLRKLKTAFEHSRRYSPHQMRYVLAQAEGDIEEFLIDHGLQGSEDRERDPKLSVTAELRIYSSAAGVAPPEKFPVEELDRALARYEEVTGPNTTYLGNGRRRAQLIRTIVINERLKG